MSSRPSVLVVGGAHLDVVARADVLQPGQSNPGKVRVGPGGAARNVAENLARLGAQVHLLCPGGKGALWDLVLRPTEAAGVCVHPVHTAREPDFYVSVNVGGERVAAVSDTRACERLRPGHLYAAMAECGAVSLVVADANLSQEVLDAVGRLPVRRALLAVSPAKAPRLSPHLSGTWLVSCAGPEAAALCGFPVRTPQEAISAARALRTAGCRYAVVTLGPEGLVWCGTEELLVPAPRVDVRDSTGAGDAVAACAVLGLLNGYPEADVARLCAWAGALTVQADGAVHPELRFEVLCERAGVVYRG